MYSAGHPGDAGKNRQGIRRVYGWDLLEPTSLGHVPARPDCCHQCMEKH